MNKPQLDKFEVRTSRVEDETMQTRFSIENGDEGLLLTNEFLMPLHIAVNSRRYVLKIRDGELVLFELRQEQVITEIWEDK